MKAKPASFQYPPSKCGVISGVLIAPAALSWRGKRGMLLELGEVTKAEIISEGRCKFDFGGVGRCSSRGSKSPMAAS